jgi:hypothetical protein
LTISLGAYVDLLEATTVHPQTQVSVPSGGERRTTSLTKPVGRTMLEIAAEMNRTDNRVQLDAPALRRERDHVSQSPTPSSTVNDSTNIGGTSTKRIAPDAKERKKARATSSIRGSCVIEKRCRSPARTAAVLPSGSAQRQSPLSFLF